MIRKKTPQDEIVIDLTGPQGNAFYLLGTAQNFLRQRRHKKEYIEKILTEMKSGDYENLIQVFEREFGDFVILER